jgi:hypothetical protein
MNTKTQIIRSRLGVTVSALALAAVCGAGANAATYQTTTGFQTVTINQAFANQYSTFEVTSGTKAVIVASWAQQTWAVGQNTAVTLSSPGGAANISTLKPCQNGSLAYNSSSCLGGAPTIQVDKGGTLVVGGIQTNASMIGGNGFENAIHADGDVVIEYAGPTQSWGTPTQQFVGTNVFLGNLILSDSPVLSPNQVTATLGLSWAAAPTQFGPNTNVILGKNTLLAIYQAAGTPLVMGGSLQGTGTLTLGAGTLVINGANTAATPFQGTLTINPGNTLVIGDASHPGAVFGDPGNPSTQTLTIKGTAAGAAILEGYGTIAANVVNAAGKIIPGGTVGTPGALTVQNYSQDATGTLKVQVSPAGSSELHVLGNAAINGSLVLSISAGNYGMQTFDLLKVDGTMTGKFSNIAVESTAGNAVAAGVLTSAHGYQVITEVVQGKNTTRPVVTGHLVDTNRLNNTYFVGSLYDQIAMDSPRASQQIGANKYVWIEGFGRHSSVSRNDVGYHTTTEGMTAGAEYRTESNKVVGLAVSYSASDLAAKGTSTADISTWHVAAYGGADLQYFRLDGVLFYNGYSSDSKRDFGSSGVAKVSPDGFAYGASVQAGLPLFRGLVTPYLRGIISRQHLDGGVENGVSLLNLRYNAINGDYFVGDVGFKIDPLHASPESKTKVLVTVALEHDFSALGEKVDGMFPVSDGLPWSSYWRGDSENTAVLGLDVARQITDKLEISGRINGRMSLFQTSGELALNAKYHF